MCGLVGVLNPVGRAVDLDVLCRMADIQRHRGPDDQGFCTFPLRAGACVTPVDRRTQTDALAHAAFGFNRLSIVDLSENGHQPMATPAGDIVMVFNGEIYNAEDHRQFLRSRGHDFRGRSDTEVLLLLYAELGIEGMLEHARGMFAIAIADLRVGKLFLVRDRLGIKPLYVTQAGESWVFSSEVKSFLEHPDFVSTLQESSLPEYVAFRYCAGDRSLLRGVRQVEPGQWVEISEAGLRAHTYWTPPLPEEPAGFSFSHAIDLVSHGIERAVKRQLVSDAPLGCQLSGGLDSSLVSAFANRGAGTGQGGKGVEGFSIVVDDPAFTEELWIDAAAKSIGMPANKCHLDEEAFASRVARASWHLEQPLNHMNSVGILLLAERSKPSVSVLLSGEGADELFGGYGRFYRALLRRYAAPFAEVSTRLPATSNPLARSITKRLASFAHSEGRDDVGWFIRAASPMRRDLLAAAYSGASFERAIEERRTSVPEGSDFLARCRNYELRTYLVDLLVRQDKMTMAHSIENRVPLLDEDLVELVCSLPSSYCVRLFGSTTPLRHNTKILLKRAAERQFNREFVYRKKEGFGIPLARFLGSKSMQPLMHDLLDSTARRGLFDAKTVRRWYETDLEQPSVAEALWIFFAFELWARQYIDRDSLH